MSSLWAYAYQIVPPLQSRRLGTIRALLREETATARSAPRTWSGRLVLERSATHILIVSDDPGGDLAVNLRLSTELGHLDAPFTVTEPLSMADHVEGVQWLDAYSGNGH